MATIYTRATKGSALTWTEGDANITNLNNAKLENVVEDTTPQLGGNLDVNGNSIVSVSNANIEIAPNGTGDVYLTADLVRVGDSNANATITTNGTGDLILSTNSGSNSGVITIQDGLDNDITVVPAGTGKVHFETSETRVGINNTNAKITTKGTGDLTLDTNSGTNSGFITIADGVDGNISITPNGTGRVVIDGIQHPIADGTANQVLQTNGSGVLSFATQSVAVSTGVSGLGTNVATALAVNVGSSGAVVTNGGALGTPSSGTLTNATGLPIGTGVSGLGTGVATFLATPSSANLISAVTDETGTGSLVFATSPTLTTPVLGTPTSGNLSNCTADGTNGVGFRVIPSAGADKNSSYTLTTNDRGEYVQVVSGGSITIPNSTFSQGDVVVIVNNHTAAITITCTITDAYIAGTDTDKATVSLATRGVCNILFLTGTRCIITGNVS